MLEKIKEWVDEVRKKNKELPEVKKSFFRFRKKSSKKQEEDAKKSGRKN